MLLLVLFLLLLTSFTSAAQSIFILRRHTRFTTITGRGCTTLERKKKVVKALIVLHPVHKGKRGFFSRKDILNILLNITSNLVITIYRHLMMVHGDLITGPTFCLIAKHSLGCILRHVLKKKILLNLISNH
jgi:hypothetical protein